MWYLQRDKADEPYNEIMGANSGRKTKERSSDRQPTILIHATKEYNRCHLWFEVDDGDVEGRSERVALCFHRS